MTTAAANQWREARKFFARAALFVAPLATLLLLDNFLLARGSFTFRAWEALAVSYYSDQLPGLFYPGQTLKKTEEGDLGHGTPLGVRKEVVWQTDSRGQRNTPGTEVDADIVIVGDSMTIGTALDQDETLAAQLAAVTGMRTYAFAFRDLHAPVRTIDAEFTRPPKYLVFERIERLIPQVEPARPGFVKKRKRQRREALPEWKVLAFAQLDYFRKLAAIRTARSWLNARASGLLTVLVGLPDSAMVASRLSSDGRMIMLEGSVANAPRSAEEIEKCAQSIASFDAGLRTRGIRMIFLPVPNKENIYWDTLAPRTKATFLPELVKRLREMGVLCVDLQTPMLAARAANSSTLLYHLDDTHWNAEGVRLATREIQKVIEALPAEGARR